MATSETAEAVLVAHQRHRGGCLCGWAELGKSLPGHQVAMLREAALLDDGARAALARAEQATADARRELAAIGEDNARLHDELTEACKGFFSVSAMYDRLEQDLNQARQKLPAPWLTKFDGELFVNLDNPAIAALYRLLTEDGDDGYAGDLIGRWQLALAADVPAPSEPQVTP